MHFSDIFSNNIIFWKKRLEDLGIQYHVAFALKATWQYRYLEICKQEWISIDVASEKELHMSIQAWIPPEQIIANWPKSIWFLCLAIETECLIVVNSYNELLQINTLLQGKYPSSKVSIICRVTTLWSRFGIDQEFFYADAFLTTNLHKNISIVWLSFHSDTIAVQEKITSIQEIVTLQQHLVQNWHPIQYVSIWWWYRVQYCTEALSYQSSREYIQWWGLYGIEFLDELLHCQIDNQSFHEYLDESFTTLIIEPWRSLLDQAGILIHTIIDKNEKWISIDGNIYSTGAIVQEMPHDPLLFNTDRGLEFPTKADADKAVHIYGNLCLESDKIYARSVTFTHEPQIWDQLIFINTAWYFADFSHSQPIGHTNRETIFI